MSTITAAAPAEDAANGVSLYRAIWRWHFFAGLLVIPFMLNLAITGSLYLFKDEINGTVFGYRYIVQPSGQALSAERIAEIAAAAVPGSRATSFKNPALPERSAIVTVASDAGARLVFVNPYDGKVLDVVGSTDEFNYVVKRIHSLAYFGTTTNRLIEITGGFAMMLVATGIYLWWPRRQTGGVVSVRGTPRRRVFWRDLHAVTGAFAGVLIFFLAMSGMPWSGYWGANANAWLTEHGLGYPVQLWDDVPKSQKVTEDILPKSGWIVEKAPVPLSDIAAAQSARPIGLDKAVEIAERLGMAPGFDMAMPSDATGVYTASLYPDNLADERTIHIDQYSGKPLIDIGFNQYPFLGKAIEWGINVHQGQEWGRFNQLLMLATCLAIILSCVTAVIMWWKRRPAGRLGVPPMPPKRSVYYGLWVITGIFAIAFPMSGLAIVAMIAFDQIVVRSVPVLKRVLA
ncbi:putative iron-regulated membrane protein [Rhizobium leguminosarum bv. trifolii WSM2297]|uniref:Putative iron-regulated membrane protein n=1 Tax=Rhizobium leguminosarum bv. trifolii WSM2297 TaxID=754762 RepID=J0CSK9_RHILT|nr:PepSY domain-containing protein [Rhizobium leguminosarum]EJC82760.1 putative iron-regulated membrane protein [Rhizobium leguminosarum bv. trifolii WSM2297]